MEYWTDQHSCDILGWNINPFFDKLKEKINKILLLLKRRRPRRRRRRY